MTITGAAEPGGMALNALLTVLSDPNIGFNAVFSAIATQLGVTPFIINFASDPTLKLNNFILGEVDPQILIDDGVAVNFPAVAMFAGKFVDNNKEKGYLFSGTAHVVLDLFVTWTNSRADQDFETLASAAKSAMLISTNCVEAQTLIPSNVCYNGNVEVLSSPVRAGGSNWLRTLRHIYLLDVNVPFPVFS